jgi:hypothetical protein
MGLNIQISMKRWLDLVNRINILENFRDEYGKTYFNQRIQTHFAP